MSSKAPLESCHASSGMVSFESRVSVPPMVTPQSPRLMEYFDPTGGAGSWRFARNSS